MTHITAEMFKEATGRDPVDDDLARCNCTSVGEMMHWGCGWDAESNLPWFMSPNYGNRCAQLSKEQKK